MTLVNKIRRQKDMNKWIMHLKKELIFGIQPRCILFLHVRKPTGILKELLEPGSKKQKRWFSLLKYGT
jgi:hypothetical protein